MSFIHFSTWDYPEADRVEASRDIYAAISRIDLDIPKREALDINTRIRLLPGVSIAFVESSRLTATRGKAQLADADDSISLMLNPGGPGGWEFDQRHFRNMVCPVGAGCVGFQDFPGRIGFHGQRTRFLSVGFSRDMLAPLVANLDRAARNKLAPSEPLRLLTRQALALTRRSDELPHAEAARMSRQLLDMTTLALGGTPDASSRALTRSLGALRLRAIKADLRVHAWRGDLSLGWVARRHGVSPSYVRALFDREGSSFTDHLLELRLRRVFERLCHPNSGSHLNSGKSDERSITDIAYAAGFNNLSWFYRAFKRRFGMTPSDVRERRMAEEEE
ncbi:helix-turn-helix transcriptional regulator [Billgrantia endophytica]|uniref:AraC family transcriptional regulator n=1 Tax=Billgrantia endophytica TaxID=2033802 RepID=A0A2N7TUX0_9GAMM|nr:AraC family transcriptional regulator [Halomonas endophytica]PMR71991.1 AraC family transcriptional regulator [Halomonas endophytica]